MLFFEPQTGIIQDHAWESNFYQFRIRNGNRNWLEAGIAAAELHDTELIYPDGFLEAVSLAEAESDDTIRRHLHTFPESELRFSVPLKQNGMLI